MILIVPIGPLPIYLISWLHDNLGVFTDNSTVEVGKAVPLPREGYDRQREQYRAEVLIELLTAMKHPGAERIVGLIDQDCYSQDLNFVFGQASLKGREAFVALPRLRPDCSGMEEDKNLFKNRVLKEIVHELGHTWGLPHCDRPGCVMRFSNSADDTDRKNPVFCSRCAAMLKR
ncbi:MAG: archaemetzincin family Zn-dependent metalloprotease [Desulfobacterales bacterium]